MVLRNILIFAASAALGCGHPGPEVAPVTGQVLLDGQQVADAGVLFMPSAGGPAAVGATEQDGTFRLATNGRDGALLGQHRVVISKSETIGVQAEEGDLSGYMGAGWKLVHHLPPRYADQTSSGLTATVERKINEFTFHLTTESAASQ